MKKLKILCAVFFVLSTAVFAAYCILFITPARSEAPEIRVPETPLRISVSETDPELLAGVTAVDAQDGDVTDSLLVEGISTFVVRGLSLVTYAAFDSDGNVSKAERDLIYTDYTPPRFRLTGALYYPVARTPYEYMDVVRATDCLDGDISGNISVLNDEYLFDYDYPGSYPIRLKVFNSRGDSTEIELDVEVYESSTPEYLMPEIRLSEYLVYTPVGQKLDPLSYVEGVTVDGVNADGVTVGAAGTVDYETPGVYRVVLACAVNGYMGRTNMYVVVTEE